MYSLPAYMLGERLNVAVIGIGGTGSAMVNELIQLDTTLRALDPNGGLDVTLIDGSNVTQANIARQSFFPSQVGMNKAEAMAWTANNLYGKNFVAKPEHFETEKHRINTDIVITALDRPSVRYQISQSTGTFLWLDMGNDAGAGQVVLGESKNTPNKTLPTICDLYDYTQLDDSDAEIKSCSAEESLARQQLGVNHFAARIGAQLLWNLLRHGKIDSNGAYFDVTTLRVEPLTDEDWRIHGFTPDAQKRAT
ncbi:PRTRC system ThiF family protein [Salinivibrio costicola]|uniref:PRTRC system ThiF family protein n=1 Tax=Salinivibrio costicola TaxID=51367 RepID=UPI0004709475|nr:PRTRC system ThiF family protein [Salinivibrio costicola]